MTNPLTPGREITAVPANKQRAFQNWLKRNKVNDLDMPGSYYDYRGAFMAGVNRAENGHWPDTFKQHGHPTFSVESQYAIPNDPEAGHWEGDQYIPAPHAALVRTLRSIIWGR